MKLPKRNSIIIEGISTDIVKEKLEEWIDLYDEDLSAGFVFDLYKAGRNRHVIEADTRLNNERFIYFVNYFYGPRVDKQKVSVEGYTYVDRDGFLPKDWKGRRVLLFIPKSEKDPFNIYAVNRNDEIIRVDFGAQITIPSIDKKYAEQRLDPSKIMFVKTFIVEKAKSVDDQKKKNKTDQITKRFEYGCLIIVGLYVIGFLFYRNTELFPKINYGIGAMVWIWFFGDYKMLRQHKYYIYAMMLSVLILLYGCLLAIRLQLAKNSELIVIGSVLPISLLLIQKPVRNVFKNVTQREPVVDKPAPSKADFLYMAMLFIGSLLVPIFISQIIPF